MDDQHDIQVKGLAYIQVNQQDIPYGQQETDAYPNLTFIEFLTHTHTNVFTTVLRPLNDFGCSTKSSGTYFSRHYETKSRMFHER